MDETTHAVTALAEIARLLERAGGQGRRAEAFRRAVEVVEALPDDERAARARNGKWADLSGVGETTARVLAQASSGGVPTYLAELQASVRPLVDDPGPLLAALRGDLHTHTDESDGGASLGSMVDAAHALGHNYLAITDHSPRLRVARGLDATRLRDQVARIGVLNQQVAPFRILTGIETDILDDGSLDQEPDLLDALDIVVASVHSKLRMDADAMTLRMVAAIANPRTDILGHCTGRLIDGDRGRRAPSEFDAEVVFEACRQFGVAVEINSRPERLDPPDDLLAMAHEMGCVFSIDTDAHAPGQLDWIVYGARKAADSGIAADRIVNSWPVERLLAWASGPRP